MKGANSLEMQSIVEGDTNPFAILEECRQVDRDLDVLNDQLDHLKLDFKKSTAESDIDKFKSNIQDNCCAIVNTIDRLRSKPEATGERNVAHVRKVVLRLTATIKRYELLLAEFRRDSEQIAIRHLRIVHTDATDSEVDDVVNNPDTPIFRQAVFNSSRSNNKKVASRAVGERHEAIQHIEKQFHEVSQLFQDLSIIVEQYEAPIINVEHGSDQAHNNVADAVKEVEPAILSARARNRSRRWCFVILGFLILVIVVITVIVALVTKSKTRA